jgi:iron complex outermembrane receptor protein
LNTPLLKRESVNMLDASIHYLFSDGKYDVALGGTNLFDERYLTIGSVNYAAGFVDGTYSPPAQWYLSLTAKF